MPCLNVNAGSCRIPVTAANVQADMASPGIKQRSYVMKELSKLP